MAWVISNLPTILIVGGFIFLLAKLGLLKKLWAWLSGTPTAIASAMPAPVAPMAIVIQALPWMAITLMILVGFIAYVDRGFAVWIVQTIQWQKNNTPEEVVKVTVMDPSLDPQDPSSVANPEVRAIARAREMEAKGEFNEALFKSLCQNPSDAAWLAAKDADGNTVAPDLASVPALRDRFCNPGVKIAEVARGLGITGIPTTTVNITGTITGTLPAIEGQLGTPLGTPPSGADGWVQQIYHLPKGLVVIAVMVIAIAILGMVLRRR